MLADLSSMFQLGTSAMQMTSAMRQKQKAERLSIVDGTLREIDDAIETVDFAYNAVASGDSINYTVVANRTQNALDAVQAALVSLRAAGAGQAGFGFAPLGPAFGPSGGGSGMATAMMPHGATTQGNMTQRTLAPQLQRMRGQLRGARQVISQLRSAILADNLSTTISVQGLGNAASAQAANTGTINYRSPELFPYANTVKLGLGLYAAWHGYKRNDGSVLWGALWGLPGVFGRSFELSALIALFAFLQQNSDKNKNTTKDGADAVK